MSQEYKQVCNTCGTVNDAYRKNCVRCRSILEELALTPGASSSTENKSISSGLSEKYRNDLFNREMILESADVYPPLSPGGGVVEEVSEDHLSAASPEPGAFATGEERNREGRKRHVLRRRSLLAIVLVLIIVFALIMNSSLPAFFFASIFPKTPPVPGQSSLPLPNGLGVIKAPNGQFVGVNDGSFQPLDVGPGRSDSSDKQQAAQALKQGNPQAAIAL